MKRDCSGTDDAIASCFSPDSRWIAFTTRGGLHRISVDSGAPFRICDAALTRGVAWVDENTIVMSDGIATGLKRVDLESGEVVAVTMPDSTRRERSHRWPTAVPGKRGVLFECQYVGRDYDQSDIQYLDLDSGQRRTVHRGGGATHGHRSGHLLFVRGNTIYARRLDLGRMEAHGQPLAVRENMAASVGNQEDDDGSAQFSVDSKGSLLYLDNRGTGNESSRLAWLDLKTGAVSVFGTSARHGSLSLSPDAKLAVLSRIRDGDENLYVHDFETGNENMLTFRASVEYVGAWSPDSRVFYWTQSSDAGDRYEVWRRPVDGSSPPEFVAQSPTQAGVWPSDISPDGRYLACAAWMGANLRDIIILDLENPEAGFQTFSASERDHNEFHWFGQDLVIYREGRGGAASLLMRHFPDDGALWSFPDTEAGYWSARRTAQGDAVLVDSPEGMYRFPIEVDAGRVRIGRAETLRTWTIEEEQRILWAEAHPDGERMLCFYSEEATGARTAPRMVYVTGWLQDIEGRIERGR